MASMNISLPGPVRDWVEKEMKYGRYDGASGYKRGLDRHEQGRASKIKAMQRLVDEAMASQDSNKSLSEIRAIARQKAGTSQKA